MLLLVLFTIGLVYRQIFNGYFQQDEWFSFAWYIQHKNLDILRSIEFFFSPSIGHYNPFTVAIQHILFSLWGMNYMKFSAIGLALHLLVTVAVYFLAKYLFKGEKIYSLATAFTFGVLASPYQGVAWVVADISTLSASFIGLVSAILFLIFLENKKGQYLILSMACLFLSLLFKEITIGLFLLFFVVYLSERKICFKWRHVFSIVGFGLAYIILRLLMYLIPTSNATIGEFINSQQSFSGILYNLVTIPFKSLAQTLILPVYIKTFSMKIGEFLPKGLSGIPGTTAFEVFVERNIMESISVITGLMVALFGFYTVRKNINYVHKKAVLFGLAWIILNSFVFSMTPETIGNISIVDSRNLYFSSVGLSIFVISLIVLLSKRKIINFLLLLLPILLINILWLNKNLLFYTKAGMTRKIILEKINYLYPELPKKAVFYTISDVPYYGLADKDKILPFQSGFGQTLLAWYYPTEGFSEVFYKDRFLWEITSQGYKEYGDRGFGYFRDMDLLKQTIVENNLPSSSIIGIEWNSKTNQVFDISSKVRSEIYTKK